MRSNIPGTSGLAFAPDGRTLAITQGGKIRLIDPATGREFPALECSRIIEGSLAFSADGRKLIAASAPDLCVWDVSTGREVDTLGTSSGVIAGLAISADGRSIAAACDGLGYCRPVGPFGLGGVACGTRGGRIMLWETSIEDEPRTVITRGRLFAVAFAPDGRTLASAESEGVRIRDANEGQGGKILDFPACSLAYAPDGRTLAIGSGRGFGRGRDGEVHLWDVATRRVRAVLKGDLGSVKSVVFAPDGRSLVASGPRGVMLWDLPPQ